MNMMNESKYLKDMSRKINKEVQLMFEKGVKLCGDKWYRIFKEIKNYRFWNKLYTSGELLPYLIRTEGYEGAHNAYRKWHLTRNEYNNRIKGFVDAVNIILESMIELTVPHFETDGATMYFDSVYDVYRKKIKYDYEEDPWYFYEFMLEQTGYMFEKELYDMWDKLGAMKKQNPIWYKICEMKAHEDMYYALVVKEHQGRFKFIK